MGAEPQPKVRFIEQYMSIQTLFQLKNAVTEA